MPELGRVPHAPSALGSAAPAASGPSPAASAAAAKGTLIKTPFFDGFDRAELGADYYVTSPVWRIENPISARRMPTPLLCSIDSSMRVAEISPMPS